MPRLPLTRTHQANSPGARKTCHTWLMMVPHAASRFNHTIRGATNHRHSLTPNGHISPFISASVRLLIPASLLHLPGPASINPNAANLFPVAAPLRHSCSCLPSHLPADWNWHLFVLVWLKKTSHGEESAGPVTRPQTWKKTHRCTNTVACFCYQALKGWNWWNGGREGR